MKFLKENKFKGLETCIFLDIETASGEKELSQEHTPELYEVWENKMAWDTSITTEEELVKSYSDKAPLYKEVNVIAAISYGYIKDGVLKIKELASFDEKEMLEELANDLILLEGAGKNVITTFAGEHFDIPILEYKCRKHGIYNLPMSLDVSGLPSWKRALSIDVQVLMKGNSSTNLSLAGACYSMGIPSPKGGEVIAKTVSEVYHSKDKKGLKKISEYCSRDVLATCNVFCKFIGEPVVEMEVVKEKVKPKQLTALQKLYSSNELTNEVKTEIKDLVEKKKLTKKDKENLFTILRGVYVRCDFVNQDQDSKQTIMDKEDEIKEFINSLK